MTSKIGPPLPHQVFNPFTPRKNYLNIFFTNSHLDSHTKTDVKPEMLSGVKTGNGILCEGALEHREVTIVCSSIRTIFHADMEKGRDERTRRGNIGVS